MNWANKIFISTWSLTSMIGTSIILNTYGLKTLYILILCCAATLPSAIATRVIMTKARKELLSGENK